MVFHNQYQEHFSEQTLSLLQYEQMTCPTKLCFILGTLNSKTATQLPVMAYVVPTVLTRKGVGIYRVNSKIKKNPPLCRLKSRKSVQSLAKKETFDNNSVLNEMSTW